MSFQPILIAFDPYGKAPRVDAAVFALVASTNSPGFPDTLLDRSHSILPSPDHTASGAH